ncbi:GGDEF domain-containing protein [Metasolibacillus meyeri]|uniref:GGDEF domain-containing protein n=1 Tax=Metasolibacillus meyeri TaxID=1071052 RepID=UPI000D30CB41|nr:GGDEF domain-containing protein [Metasolibacillus meyeri]
MSLETSAISSTIQSAFNDKKYKDVLEQVNVAIDLAKSHNERFIVAKLYDIKINSYMFIGLPARAHETLTEFHSFIEQYGTVESAIWFHLCAVNLWESGSSAIDGIVYRHVKKALAYGTQTTDPNLKRRVYGTMSSYLMNIGEYERSCDYLELAFFYAQLTVEQKQAKESLIYSMMVDLVYLNTVLERFSIAENINNVVYQHMDDMSSYQKGIILQNCGYLFMQQGNYERAIEEFQQLALYTDTFKDTSLKAIAYQYMCECMEKINHPDLIKMFKMQVKVLNDLLDERETEHALEAEMNIQRNQILHQTSMDALTDIYNRKYFELEAAKILQHLDKSAYTLLAIIDLDYFKQINDTYGHLIGDEALKTVGSRLKTFALQKKAIVGRYGGDEFLLICSNKNRRRLEGFAETLHRDLSLLTVENDSNIIHLSFSIGLTLTNRLDSLKPLLHQADEALYSVKKNGRGHFAFYHGNT